MKITVIVPTYNEEQVIGECLRSLVDQKIGDFEIIVVDDGSTDGTLQVLSEFKSSKVPVRVLRAAHGGPGAARNLAAKKAKSKVLVFVDADMTFDTDFLNNLTLPIEQGKMKGSFSKEEYVSNWDNVWARCWNINENWIAKRRHPADYPDEQVVFRAILKSEFDKVGGFAPGGYNDDWSLSQKLGYPALAVSGAKFYHKNPSSLGEIFHHARWIGKRPYKLGIIGSFYALLRAFFVVSLIVGLAKSIKTSTPEFLIFKLVYDFGITLGILGTIMGGRRIK